MNHHKAVRIFYSYTHIGLENQINDWIESEHKDNLRGAPIYDIKYSSARGENGIVVFSAMIIFRKFFEEESK